jgi:hypothetical protein
LINTPESARCDCGYDFISGTRKRSYLTEKDHDQKHGDKAIREENQFILLRLLMRFFGS